MTDLARLMNPDDDQDDPVTISRPNIPAPRPISHQHHYLAQPTSGFGNSGQRSRSFPHISISSLQNPATPTPQPSTPPPPPPPPATTATSSTTSTTSTAPRPPRRRRYSLTNTVTIDVPYVPCPPGMSPPHYPVPTSPEPGMRLTPVTRRPSKAKKGLAVHSCEECPKTFTRAEHLRRHKLSHQPPRLNCPFRGCNKTFHRKDLLERHQARHASHGPAPPNLPRGPGLAMPSGYNSQTSPQASLIANRPREAWPTVPRSTQQSQSRPSSIDYRTNRQNFDHDIQPPTPENYTPDFTKPEVSAPMEVVMRDASTPIPSQDSPGGPSSSDESPYTPSNTSGPSQQRAEIYNTDWSTVYNSPTIMPTTSTMLPVGPVIPIHSPPFGPLAQPNFSEALGIIPSYEDPGIVELEGMNNIAFDGIFSRLPMAQPSETMVATATLHPGQGGYNTACGQEQLAMFDYMRTQNPIPAPLTQEDIEAIPAYLDVYWQKFDALIPIIHKATFEDTTETREDDIDTLRCAMAAVATSDFDGREHRVRGEKLYNHASYKARVFVQAQGRRSVPLEQAVFLCEYYARFRGKDKESYLQSPTAVSLYQRAFNYVSNNRRQPQLWREWIKFESWRRLLSACFLLDVHVARYYEQHYAHIQGLDYSSPRTLPIPLTSSTNGAWDAPDSETWRMLRPARFLKALSTLHWDVLDASELSSMPTFDSAILLAAHSLELASRLHPDRVELVEQSVRAQPAVSRIDSLFPESGVANAYLALHYTPLYCLLAVSGESWVFNKKILDHELFKSYKSTLRQWRSSGNAAMATIFAARGLKAFLNLDSEQSGSNLDTESDSVKSGVSWTNLSDYWGIYVCVLICWAFGHAGKRQDENEPPSLDSAKQWISQVARMEPGHVRNWSRRHEAHGVVAVGREILAKDCLGGGRLFPFAVSVLEKLEQGASWTWVSGDGTGRG